MTIQEQCPYKAVGLTEESVQEWFIAQHEEITDKLLRESLYVLRHTLKRLDQAIPCRQFQLALDDIESAESHLRELIAVGPRERLRDTPLEESEVEDEGGFEEVELKFAEPHVCEEGYDPSIAMGTVRTVRPVDVGQEADIPEVQAEDFQPKFI